MARERERILMSMAMNWKKHENERRGEGGSEEEQEEEGGRRHRSRLELSPPSTAVGAGGVHILMHTLAHLPPSKTQDKYPKRRQIQPLCAALG